MNWSALPTLSALRAFCAYTQSHSVSAAGRTLNVSHAAISQQLRNLEAHLGLALFDRTGRRMELTLEGETLARALNDSFGQMIAAIEALTGADTNRALQISVTPTFAAAWLMPRLGSFREAHPGIPLTIDPSAHLQTLTPGGLDVAVRYGAGPWPGVENSLLLPSPIAVVAAPGLVDAQKVSSPADLRGYHWLQEIGTNETTAWFAKHGVAQDSGLSHVSLPGNLVLEAARAGEGVAIVARINVAADLASKRLVSLFEDDHEKGYHIVTRPGVLRPPLKAFVTWLRREAAKT